VIVVDLAMQAGSLNGLAFLRRLRRFDQQTPVLVLTMHRDPIVVGRTLEAGASGYVLKDAPPEEIVLAFAKVLAGTSYLSQDLSAGAEPQEGDDGCGTLMPREKQILTLMSEGRSYKEIALELGVSYSTVAKACTRLKNKLGVRSRPELIRIAVERVPKTGRLVAV
jgi:two-component system invasion response regulator UvrY